VRLRIRLPSLAAFLTVSLILATFSDLAGPLSSFLSIFVPVLCLASLAHLFLSWRFFSFHQNFSTDHPQKGETVHYGLHMINEGALPLAQGYCGFSCPGLGSALAGQVQTPSWHGEKITQREDIHCPWRGSYEVGLSSISFRGALGLFELYEGTEPRIFYVYPELVPLDPSIGSLATTSGVERVGAGTLDDDQSIFEYVGPLRSGASSRRIAWKRWAATGMPAEILTGQSRSSALRLVLDLRPCSADLEERLPAEDMAMSAAFSVLQELAWQGIPVEFILGGEENGILLDGPERFLKVFDSSTSILFKDPRLPLAAFSPGPAVLLVTTRALVEPASNDLFTLYEDSLSRGMEPHLLLCPPPGRLEEERRSLEALMDRRGSWGGRKFLRLVDSSSGTRELTHALRP